MNEIDQILDTIMRQQVCYHLRRQMFKSQWTDEQMLELFNRVGRIYEPDYCVEPQNKACVVNLVKWLFNDPTMKSFDPTNNTVIDGRLNRGIYLYGKTGVGKTLALKILGRIAFALGLKYEVDGTRYSLKWEPNRCDEITDRYAHGASLDDYIHPVVMWFDDLGTEPNDVLYMGNRINPMRQIIEQRGDGMLKLTLITSNLPINDKDMENKYGPRAVSRLVDMCNYFVMKGQDHRLCISPKKK